MRITNRFDLPEAIVRGARKVQEQYDNGGADVSVTQLIAAPQVNLLRKRHFGEMEKDISEEWFALFGSAVHYILSLGVEPGQVPEERLHVRVNGCHLSGAVDLQTPLADGTWRISDYKVAPVYAVQKNDGDGKGEWEAQLNTLAFLVETVKGVTVSEVEVVALLRDWQRSQAQSDVTYPPSPVHKVPIRLWSQQEREDYVRYRIFQFQDALMRLDFEEPLPECTNEERWVSGEKWAAKKKGNKKASKVFDNPLEAGLWVAENETAKAKFDIEHRPGKSVRCAGNYCGVAPWCAQWAEDPTNPKNIPEEQTQGKEDDDA